jgi:hypothetical protein
MSRLNSLWVGKTIGWIEELCLRSAVATGQSFTVYSYTPHEIVGLPPGIDLADARDVMPESLLLRYADSGAVQLGSNIFRYHLLKKSLGYWVDMDFYFLKPLNFTNDYVFGYEREDSINSAILKIPANSEMLRIIFQLMQPNVRPPWYGPKRTLLYYGRKIMNGPIKIEDLPWGTFGPQLVTYAARKSGCYRVAQQQSVFYPVAYDRVGLFLEPADKARQKIEHGGTVAIHLYRSAIERLLKTGAPPVGSYLADACKKLGVTSTDL